MEFREEDLLGLVRRIYFRKLGFIYQIFTKKLFLLDFEIQTHGNGALIVGDKD